MYNMMLSDLELFLNKVNWVSLVRHLLMSLGFYQVWLNQGVGNISIFISVFKQRLTDIFIQNWQERLGRSSRARFYNSFAIFHLQPYLEIINVHIYSQAFSKLRMTSHRLEIETSRWVKPVSKPLDERDCSVCGVLEDEYHFVIECSMYIELRKKYIPVYYWKRPSMHKFVNLINSTKANHLRKLGTFVYQVFKHRSEVLYMN